MKRKRLLVVLTSMLCCLCMGIAACGEESSENGGGNGSGTEVTTKQLSKPFVVISEDGLATWTAVDNASGYIYKIDGGAEKTTLSTSVQLIDGQSISVKAVGDGVNYTDSDFSASQTYTSQNGGGNEGGGGGDTPTATALATPVVSINTSGLASWSAIPNASGYIYKINGGAEQLTSSRYVQLTNGQSIVVKAIGDDVNYTDSAYSASQTYTSQGGDGGGTTTPVDPATAPTYLGILASNSAPNEGEGIPGGLASVTLPTLNAFYQTQSRTLDEALDSHFENADNYIGATLPTQSEYPLYSAAGQTVYIQIWLNNPEQYTILSMKLNGTKYQVSGGLSSFFIEEGGEHYNCVYVAVTIPSGSYVEKSYTVTDIEYVANTYINPDGTDEFMNENDTITIGLPYEATTPTVSDFTPTGLTYNSASATFTLSDRALVDACGGWIGVAVYDNYNIMKNAAVTVGSNEVTVEGLAENTGYYVYVYVYGDLHDGRGVCEHTIYSFYFTTESVLSTFETEATYYQEWGFEELGEEADSGLAVSVRAYFDSPTAEVTRVELYKGETLVQSVDEFYYSTQFNDLLARTDYTVKLYYTDVEYTEHCMEQYVTTGSLEAPEIREEGNYAFFNGAALTFSSFENGFLRVAIAKDVSIRVYANMDEARYGEYILQICDNPNIVAETEALAEYYQNAGDWSAYRELYVQLNNLRWAQDCMQNGDYSSYGADKAKWQALINSKSATYTYDSEDMFKNDFTMYVIVRDYFEKFGTDTCYYEIMANVDFKDGNGFVKTELLSDSISLAQRNYSENGNSVEFAFSVDGYNVTVVPTSYIEYKESKLATVSYTINLYTRNGEFVDTLEVYDEVNWETLDEKAWIDRYIAAMKGEAILPATEAEIIEELGWRAIFEITNGLQIETDPDYIGGSGNGTITEGEVVDGTVTGGTVVDGNGNVVVGGGAGEKNIANLAERQLLRDLLAYEYPEGDEYSFKTQMLAHFMNHYESYDIVAGLETEDEKLEALIANSLNSIIVSVVNGSIQDVYNFMWSNHADTSPIFVGFESTIRAYMEENGVTSTVNWANSYRRIMSFKEFEYFYPYGEYTPITVTIDPTKYKGGEYKVGVEFRFEDFFNWEDGSIRYEKVYMREENIFQINGPMNAPTVSFEDIYVATPQSNVDNFWDYYFVIEIVKEDETVVYSGRWDTYSNDRYNEAYALAIGYKVRARAMVNSGVETFYENSAWSDWLTFEGVTLEAPRFGEYNKENNTISWYSNGQGGDYTWLYTINGNPSVSVGRWETTVALSNGDVLKVKAVAPEGSAYFDSEWATYTCVDNREAVATPINVTLSEDNKILSWQMPNTDNVDTSSWILYNNGVAMDMSDIYVSGESGTWSCAFYREELGAVYQVQAKSNDYEQYRNSALSEAVAVEVTLANPTIKTANESMIYWDEVDNATSYWYKINDGEETKVVYGNSWESTLTRLELTKLGITLQSGDKVYIQARAEGATSSEWVLAFTKV